MSWNADLSEIIGSLDMSKRPSDSFESLATFVNNDNEAHASERKSFKRTFETALSEAADSATPFATRLLVRKFEKQFVRNATGEETLRLNSTARQALFALLNHPQSQALLPTLHIYAALHALIRWNKGHQLRPNDFHDFHHACAALGYCDVFLTENTLKSHLTSTHLQLDKFYDGKVAATADEAVKAVDELRHRRETGRK